MNIQGPEPHLDHYVGTSWVTARNRVSVISQEVLMVWGPAWGPLWAPPI